MNRNFLKTYFSLCLLLITSLAFGQIANAQSTGLSLEDIVGLKRVSGAYMSPKGDRIAYLLSVPRELYKEDDGKPHHELHVVDFDGVSRAYVTGEIEITAVAWSVDGASLYFLAMRDPEATVNSLFEISLGGGEAVEKFSHVNSISKIYPSPDGKTMAFL
ncbi:MAG: hypothetical protein ACR2RD_11900, partial [Woeseiaceae bacterium]